MSTRGQPLRRAAAVAIVTASVAAAAAVGWLWASGRRQAMWATTTTDAGRHLGLARFADAAVVYYVPLFTMPTSHSWSTWTTAGPGVDDYHRAAHAAVGFRWERSAINVGDAFVAVPYWALLAAALTPAGVVAGVWSRRRRRRVRAGHCRRCGYDLRASPERCPECGSTAVA